ANSRLTIRFQCLDIMACPRTALELQEPLTWLRALVSLDDEIDGRYRLPQFDRILVFGRLPAIEGRLIRWKLDHRIAAAACPFRVLEAAGPYQEAGAVFPQWFGIGSNISVVSLLINDVDAYDPVALCHRLSFAVEMPV